MKDDIVHTFHSKDGHLVSLRPLKPSDAHHLVDLFEHMGADSRFLRFNQSLTDPEPERVWAEAERMARVNPGKDGAWLAFMDLPGQENAPVAGARYIRLDEKDRKSVV